MPRFALFCHLTPYSLPKVRALIGYPYTYYYYYDYYYLRGTLLPRASLYPSLISIACFLIFFCLFRFIFHFIFRFLSFPFLSFLDRISPRIEGGVLSVSWLYRIPFPLFLFRSLHRAVSPC